MTDEAARLAYARQVLDDIRQRSRRGGYWWPMQLEAVWLVVSNRQGPSDVDTMTDGREDLTMKFETCAARLGVSKSTVERLVRSGALPSVDIGGCPRVRAADLAAYVADRPVRSA